MRTVLLTVVVLVLASCGSAGSGVAPDMMNPQAPQAGAPFPYNSPWCN
jgi:hypothetical protein